MTTNIATLIRVLMYMSAATAIYSITQSVWIVFTINIHVIEMYLFT